MGRKDSGKKILIVDDDEQVLETLSTYLTRRGYIVETAKKGSEAIKKSQAQLFNLAILDIRLPDMDGTELLTRMAQTEPKMKKIMLTGYPNMENAMDSVNKQADAFVIKPADPAELAKLIRQKLVEQEQELKMDRKKLVTYIESRDKETT